MLSVGPRTPLNGRCCHRSTPLTFEAQVQSNLQIWPLALLCVWESKHTGPVGLEKLGALLLTLLLQQPGQPSPWNFLRDIKNHLKEPFHSTPKDSLQASHQQSSQPLPSPRYASGAPARWLCHTQQGVDLTYASEPQRRVRDFCVSLLDLSELRQALNFPSRAGKL